MPRRVSEEKRMLGEALETAAGLSAYGVMSKSDMEYCQVLCKKPPDYSADNVVSIRKNVAKMSQSVFAALLNVNVSTVQMWESPTAGKRPRGPAAKLLQLVETKGVEALLV